MNNKSHELTQAQAKGHNRAAIIREAFEKLDDLDEKAADIREAKKEVKAKLKEELGLSGGAVSMVLNFRKMEQDTRAELLEEVVEMAKATNTPFFPGFEDAIAEAGNDEPEESEDYPAGDDDLDDQADIEDEAA